MALVLAAGPAVAVTAPRLAEGHEVFAFADPAIDEASGLVVTDGLFVTTNDSGDIGRVFTVDDTGATVGVTHWSADPTDCEALAPGGDGYVWVGDIGDNLADRATVSVTRVPVGRGDRDVSPQTFRLRYPRGHPDAETLVRDPRTGRLYIATKNVFGGTLFALPAHLRADRVNRLRPVGPVLSTATDGAFTPDGRHLLVRNYGIATVYDWPSLKPVGSMTLPTQQQGEGLAVADDGGIYLSSEGLHAPVVRVTPTPAVRRVLAAPTSPQDDPSDTDDSTPDVWPWALGGLVGLAAVVVLVRSLRPR